VPTWFLVMAPGRVPRGGWSCDTGEVAATGVFARFPASRTSNRTAWTSTAMRWHTSPGDIGLAASADDEGAIVSIDPQQPTDAVPSFGQPQDRQPQFGLPQAPPPQAPQAPAYAAPQAPQYGQPQGQQQYGQPRLADWGSRVGAYLIDSLMASAVLIVAMIVASVCAAASISIQSDGSIATPWVTIVCYVVGYGAYIGVLIWNRWLRQGRTGRSVGKSVLKIRLISADTGRPVGAGTAFLRDLVHIADGFLYIGFLFPLWDQRKQTFADKACNTLVVTA
jgi:uncharacterized RDD family membrane protein YckC